MVRWAGLGNMTKQVTNSSGENRFFDGFLSVFVYVGDLELFSRMAVEIFYRASGCVALKNLFIFLSGNWKVAAAAPDTYKEGDTEEVESVATSLGCSYGTLPFMYLGLPVGKKMHFCEGWGDVVNRLRNRLSAWKAKSLSVGGRLTLIKSILDEEKANEEGGGVMKRHEEGWKSLHVRLARHASIFGVGVDTEEVESVATSLGCSYGTLPFMYLGLPVGKKMHFCEGWDGSRGISWVKWNSILLNHKMGGLGVGSLLAKNLGLIGKWKWRFLNEKEALWRKVIKEFYGENGGFESSPQVLSWGEGASIKLPQLEQWDAIAAYGYEN
ncbi:RNA-directed DNA polymerase, eukaryota, Reverse transcriptase zinc-binding domain protein [Artemisia annua]|uniref:RNA-directed DNA polymerase, eukaryota, Reverse transcriptase zinc-binding domain protein n=1 Tax=Artemisia annua TaxID=35608 RepID=A0A2U1MCT7_ARTAN|nr:RNA-directed DNA polymerase, eukaryota, Reverse transcriptase zinc-binding domain protein [Artemisia annua]